PYTTEGSTRNHTVIIDRPEAKGGTDKGMMGGEMLLVALGGCFNSNLLEIIRNRESGITDVNIDVVGTLEGTPPRFTAIEMQIAANYDDRTEIEKFVTMAERGCIVANSIGPAIDLTFTVLEPDAVQD
ncbi:MAG: OsmC family protein, partial [Chloroflexota bacterium]